MLEEKPFPVPLFYLFININQLDALNFIISLFQACTCFEHMCLSSGGQIVLYSLWYHHTYRWPSRALVPSVGAVILHLTLRQQILEYYIVCVLP